MFRCQVTSPGDVKVTASVCDDGGTMCVPETFVVRVEGKGPPPRPGGVLTPAGAGEGERGHLRPIDGFLMDEPDKALAEAKASGKPIFIHFGAIWCPPCNMLEELAYPSAAFKEASSGFVRLRLDADAPVSWDWKARFKVGGYPTLLAADARLRELGRLVGYRSPAELSRWLDEMAAAKEPVEASKDPKRLGLWHYERGEYAQAERLLAPLKDAESHRFALMAREGLARRDDRPKDLAAALEALANDFPADVEFSAWLHELLELDRPFAQARLDQAELDADAWAADPKLARTEFTCGDVLEGVADLLDDAGRKDAAVSYYKKAAAAYEALASSSTLAVSRGPNIERAYCLGKAGEKERAQALYEALVKAYPDEYTFRHGYARLLLDEGRPADALEQAKLSTAHAYGDHWLRAVHLEAEILLKLGRLDEARKAVANALAEAALPRSIDVRTHRYIAQLRALDEKLH